MALGERAGHLAGRRRARQRSFTIGGAWLLTSRSTKVPRRRFSSRTIDDDDRLVIAADQACLRMPSSRWYADELRRVLSLLSR